MTKNRFGKTFRSMLNEAPVNLSEPPIPKTPGVENPITDNKGLQQDLTATSNIVNTMPIEKEKTLKQIRQWIGTAGTLAKEINEPEPGSWATTIKKVFADPKESERIVAQLSKAASTLDAIKNDLSLIVNKESGNGVVTTPPTEAV